MADSQLHTLLEGGAFFESPRWHDGRWWVSDFYRHLVLSVSASGEPREVLEVEEQPSGLGWMPDGSMLVVSMRDHRILRWSADAGVTQHAAVREYCGGHLNDMVVDMQGRAYVGNFGFDLMGGGDPAPANLIRVDPDGAASIAAEDLLFPNGSVITPDGKTLIVGETAGARYTAFTIHDDGTLSDRRVWAQIAPTPAITTLAETLSKLQFGPDGCGLDAENHIWCADEVNARCVRIAPGGDIVDQIKAPDGLDFFACMLGGDDGRTLLICAAPDFAEVNRTAAREAVLLTTTVDVPHGGLP
jgi:sugar lactone lactonase YvrE